MRDLCSSQLQHRETRIRSKPYNVLTCWANAFLWATNQECGCFQQRSLPSCWDSEGTEGVRQESRRGKPAPWSTEEGSSWAGRHRARCAGCRFHGVGRGNFKLKCEQLLFIVHLLKQRTATCRVIRTHKPSSFYILICFFVPASMFLKS